MRQTGESLNRSHQLLSLLRFFEEDPLEREGEDLDEDLERFTVEREERLEERLLP